MTTKPLVDLARPMRVRLHLDDVVRGDRSSPSSCVIARGIHRLRGVVDQRVGAIVVRIEYRDRIVRAELARNDRALVAGFDKLGAAFADGYVATLLPPSRPLGTRRGQTGSNRRSGSHDSVVRRRPSTRHIDVDPGPVRVAATPERDT